MLARAANIRYGEGRKTNRPIARLYPLEVSSSNNSTKDVTETEDPTSSTATNEFTVSPSCVSRPTRTSAIKARQNITNWTRALLSPPPEDVQD